jgi:hypothetical protein
MVSRLAAMRGAATLARSPLAVQRSHCTETSRRRGRCPARWATAIYHSSHENSADKEGASRIEIPHSPAPKAPCLPRLGWEQETKKKRKKEKKPEAP